MNSVTYVSAHVLPMYPAFTRSDRPYPALASIYPKNPCANFSCKHGTIKGAHSFLQSLLSLSCPLDG